MQILLLLDTDNFAGTERHVLDLAIALRERGASPILGCPSGSPLAQRGATSDLPHFALPRGGFFNWRAISQLARALRAGQFDVLHVHNGRTHCHAALAIALARRGALVATQHFIAPAHTHQRGLKKAIFRRVHHFLETRTARFIAISKAVEAAMLKRGEGDAERIVVVPNGIGDPLQNELGSATETRRQWNVDPDAPLLVCAARLEREKDHATLIEAFARVQKSRPDARLLLAGQGALQNELQNQIEKLHLGESARILGFVQDIFPLLRAADIFVLPSPSEPFGLVFLEAMALSKPVVACAAGAAPEIVEPQKTGVLVPPHSPDAMATALEFLLSDVVAAQKMGQEGRTRYESHFTRDLMAKRTLDVYEAAKRGQN
jgi:glycosyltransferase involved in cell wall biosynthesis